MHLNFPSKELYLAQTSLELFDECGEPLKLNFSLFQTSFFLNFEHCYSKVIKLCHLIFDFQCDEQRVFFKRSNCRW